MPTILNAANEIAVAAFMAGRIGFYGIADLVGAACERMAGRGFADPATVAEALAIDDEMRTTAGQLLSGLKASAG
jgi:1-deoxy-D-xylulose-5-phosphate reductoisomerase